MFLALESHGFKTLRMLLYTSCWFELVEAWLMKGASNRGTDGMASHFVRVQIYAYIIKIEYIVATTSKNVALQGSVRGRHLIR